MGLQFPDQKHHNCFFVTTSFYKHQPLGLADNVFLAMEKSLIFCLKKYHSQLSAYVLMPTHLHLLLFVNGEQLGNFMRDFKKYIAEKEIISKGIGQSPVWEQGYDRVAISSRKIFQIKLAYIHNNPVKARLAGRAENWQWSSAAAYFNEKEKGIPVFKGW